MVRTGQWAVRALKRSAFSDDSQNIATERTRARITPPSARRKSLKKILVPAFVYLFLAGFATAAPKVRASVTVAITPPSATVNTGAAMVFTAKITGSTSAPTWKASCGTIDSSGRYTAPASASTCEVRATVARVTSSPATVAVVVETPPPPGDTVINVPYPGPGVLESALSQAITAAQTGPVTIVLASGDYPGNFAFPRTGASNRITLTAAASVLPADGVRMTPAYQGYLPRLVPTQPGSATVTVSGDNYTFRGLQVEAPGVGVTSIDLYPDTTGVLSRNLVFDQMLIRGSQTTGGHRGVAMNGINIAVTNSWIDRMWEVGRDSQAVAAWDTPGPLTIDNNYLEASGENFLLGGAIPSCACVPTDVTFTRNTVNKDAAWRLMSQQPQVKNLLEVKYGRRILISGNTFERNWMQAQTGWSILFTTMGVEGTAWTVVEDVTFTRNIVRHISSGINIAAVTGPLHRLRVDNNVFQDMDDVTYGGDGRWAMIQTGTAGVTDVAIEHNTVIGITGNQFLSLTGSVPLQRFAMTHMVVEHRDYGIHSTAGLAVDALNAMAPGSLFTDNAITGPHAYWLVWPLGNFEADVNVADQFDARYAIKPGSPLAGLPTSDASPVGADPSLLPQ
jgi:hypothetical protein